MINCLIDSSKTSTSFGKFLGNNVVEKRDSMFSYYFSNGAVGVDSADTVVPSSVGLSESFRTFSTLLSDNQLHDDHGLAVVGNSDTEQWLMPRAFSEAEGYNSPAVNGWRSTFLSRVEELRRLAAEEGIVINLKSLESADRLAARLRNALEPSIYLLDNGNFRFVWHDETDAQVGFQFLPNGRVQYVMLGGSADPDSKFYGDNRVDELLRLLRASDFRASVFGN